MNYIEQIFDRCRLETICEFLMHGSEAVETKGDGYYERARKAEKRLNEWLHKQFADDAEFEAHSSLVYAVISEMQSIYMQIGLQAGMMLAAEFCDGRNKG